MAERKGYTEQIVSMRPEQIRNLEKNADLVRWAKAGNRVLPIIYSKGKIYIGSGTGPDGTVRMAVRSFDRTNPALHTALAHIKRETPQGAAKGFHVSGKGKARYDLAPGQLSEWVISGKLPEGSRIRPKRGERGWGDATLTAAAGSLPFAEELAGKKGKVLGSKAVQGTANFAKTANTMAGGMLKKKFGTLASAMDKFASKAAKMAAIHPSGRLAGLGLKGLGLAGKALGGISKGTGALGNAAMTPMGRQLASSAGYGALATSLTNLPNDIGAGVHPLRVGANYFGNNIGMGQGGQLGALGGTALGRLAPGPYRPLAMAAGGIGGLVGGAQVGQDTLAGILDRL